MLLQTHFLIGHPFGLADQALQALDWSALTWELYLDGAPLDLEAFGVHQYVMPDLAPNPSPIREIFRQMKAWDVVLINPTPGVHTLRGRADTEADTYTWIVNFTIEAFFTFCASFHASLHRSDERNLDCKKTFGSA